MNTKLRNEDGAVAVIVAVMLVALIGALAIVVDVGMLYQQRRQLQTAVDAAALAANIELAEGRGPTAAQSVATQYVDANKGTTAPVSTTVSFPTANTVRVAASVNRDLWFARVFGRTSQAVGARATARFETAGSARNLVPIAVPESFVAGHTGPGNTGTFTFGDDRPVNPFTKSFTTAADGVTFTFTITFINDKGKPVDVTIRDPLPRQLTFVQGSADQGGTYNAGTRTLSWTFTGVADGDSRTVTFKASEPKTKCYAYYNIAYADITGYPSASAQATAGSPQQGYFWLVDLENAGNTGTPKYDDWIRNGYPAEVGMGMIQNGPGMVASLRDAVQWRMDNHPKVLVPLFDYTRGSGRNGSYHVCGFAEFYITGNSFKSNNKSITGYFTNGTVVTDSHTPQDAPPVDHGVRVIELSE